MKQIWLLVRIIICFVLIFAAYKPVFICYNATDSVSAFDLLCIWWHALPLDLSTACYLTAPVLFFLLITNWIPTHSKKPQPQGWRRGVLYTYLAVAALVVAICLSVDCVLYSFWNFKLDAAIWNYIGEPQEIIASASWPLIVGGLVVIVLLTGVLFVLLRLALSTYRAPQTTARKLGLTLALILMGGLMFLGIRGSIGRSTMNVGRAYFSSRQFINHAGVNPLFSLISSSLKSSDANKTFNFFPNDQLANLWQPLAPDTSLHPEVDSLQNTRPDVLLILLESFFANFIEPLGGEAAITPEFNRLAREGWLFTQCYAAGYRTDRAHVSTLSGYPSFPHLSVMKLPQKTRTLPSLARSLQREGYNTTYIYGGDIQFANKVSYLVSTGYQQTIGDTHFPITTRTTHAWGVTDHIMLDTLYNLTQRTPSPYFITAMTLSSHEPWVVPYDRISNNPKANAMAYTDHSLGLLIERLRQSPRWDNLLIILLADHGTRYPANMPEDTPQRYHVPLLMLGGAISEPRVINQLCSQTDLPATLLDMMNISHTEYTFSRDILSPTYKPSVYYTGAGSIAFIDSTGYTIYDLNAKQLIADRPTPSAERLDNARATLQLTTNDFVAR